MLGADHSSNVCWTTQSRVMLGLVLDAVLPTYEVREYHETAVHTSPEAALAAVLALPAACDPVVGALFWIRRIPGGSLPLRDFLPQLQIRPAISTPTAFVALGDLLGVTIAFAFWAVPLSPATGARLVTETRGHFADAAARRGFFFYWLVLLPVLAVIWLGWQCAAEKRVGSPRS